MSAPEKERLDLSKISKLGIIAGGGDMPSVLVEACQVQGIEPFIIAFDGQTDPALLAGDTAHFMTRLGAVSAILKTLKNNGIRDLVLVGKIRRPSFSELRPDLVAAEFFAKYGVEALGDDGLLKALRRFLGEKGFAVHGIHKFADDLLTPDGVLGKAKPSKGDLVDIERGIEVISAMGPLDVGQAVIVQEGIVLGVEAAEGTDELIKRCAGLKREGRGGVLVKMSKPGQDQDLDLPSAGMQTIQNAIDAGLAGVVLHAGHSLLLDRGAVIQHADAHKVFVMGVEQQA